jgi:erythromycin esterase
MRSFLLMVRETRSLVHVMLAAVLLLAGLTTNPAAAQPFQSDAQRGIYQLAGTDPNLPTTDLEPLRNLLDGASVVGLGESVHTSGGFYLMKDRVFRFLVETMGFRAFGFETPWDFASRATNFVETCQGTADDARKGLLGVWQATEVRDLLQWMCDWNQAHPKDKVHFFGFDIQEPGFHGPALLAFLDRIGLPAGDPRVTGVQTCYGVTDFPDEVSDSDAQICKQALADIGTLFKTQRQQIIHQTSRDDLDWADLRRVDLDAWEDDVYWSTRDLSKSLSARDTGMAYTFEKVRELRYGPIKTVLWAANDHILKDGPELFGFHSMGESLDHDFGHRYAAIGLTTHDLFLNWPGIFCGGPVPLQDGGVESILHGVGEGDLLVDFHSRNHGGQAPFLNSGQTYPLGPEDLMVPGRSFDGLVYLERSPAMTPLRFAVCQ